MCAHSYSGRQVEIIWSIETSLPLFTSLLFHPVFPIDLSFFYSHQRALTKIFFWLPFDFIMSKGENNQSIGLLCLFGFLLPTLIPVDRAGPPVGVPVATVCLCASPLFVWCSGTERQAWDLVILHKIDARRTRRVKETPPWNIDSPLIRRRCRRHPLSFSLNIFLNK